MYFFQLIQVTKNVEIDVGFLVIYFLLLFWRQTTHTALRHTSKYHVWRLVKQNGREEKYRSQPPNIGRIEWTYRERIVERSSNTKKMTTWCTFLYFKDHAVFSLNATGAFSDGIFRAVSWFEIINIAFTQVIPVKYNFLRISKLQ